ncbi:MAG: alpha/beta fold hydrolase [Rhodobacteraceae bacterium]|nr:alpha/beta fold hydrolase [Paracoccaceae bacterium]
MTKHDTTLARAGDTDIRVMRAGEGPTLVLLHGSTGASSWLPFMARLAERYTVIVPEHPGFGGSTPPDWLDNIHDLAYFYLDFFRDQGLEDIHLVGQSLGGWLAAEIAVRNTSRLKSLTLVGAAGLRVPGVEQMDPFLCTDEERIRGFFHDQAMAERTIARLAEVEDEDISLANRFTVARLSWSPRGHDPHLYKWLHRIDVPTLLVWGDHDRMFPLSHGEEYARRIPGSRLAVIGECGHIPTVEKPEEFCRELSAFIDATEV